MNPVLIIHSECGEVPCLALSSRREMCNASASYLQRARRRQSPVAHVATANDGRLSIDPCIRPLSGESVFKASELTLLQAWIEPSIGSSMRLISVVGAMDLILYTQLTELVRKCGLQLELVPGLMRMVA